MRHVFAIVNKLRSNYHLDTILMFVNRGFIQFEQKEYDLLSMSYLPFLDYRKNQIRK